MMAYILPVVAAVFCAYRVMRARRLMAVTIWLAIVSALTATLLFSLGAYEVAVIELSVGAWLVTVLFVFAFSIVGEETFDKTTIIPRPLAWLVVILLLALLGWMALPLAAPVPASGGEASFGTVLWEHRGLDVLIQVVFIFAGVMGLIGLLSEVKKPALVEAQALAKEEAHPGEAFPIPEPLELGEPTGEEVHA
jgi:NADH:ubiquinone oxidoreductase subunit 6 (subunit J)